MTSFVAVDGEADDRGRYILLCDSTGRVLHNPDGIRTAQALEWLLPLGAIGSEVMCFGLNYDANQWIEGLSERELKRLAKDGRTTHRLRWRLDWTPAKFLELRDVKTGRRVKVCEAFGFFQSSFVNALKAWGLEPPAEIETMKVKRGTFIAAELDRVTKYCLAECRLLVQLMNKLLEACENAGCVPQHDWWIGAGSIASTLLRQHGVKHHHAHDTDIATRPIVEDLILGAYFGGRVELLAQGVFPVCETRDVRSAYPAAATNLPSLINTKTVERSHYQPHLACAIWHVRWKGQCHGQLAPFPVRGTDGTISYPRTGQGCYHAAEVDTAIKLGYEIEIIRGVELQQQVLGDPVYPFDWIRSVFKHRARLKVQGDPAEKALKLGLNSVYGKLAQGYGRNGLPPFQSFWWAGQITSTTRARMLELAHRSSGLAMISTDGLFTTRCPVKGQARPYLGSWEPDRVKDLFCAQPGVYEGFSTGGRRVVKSRGFFQREVDYGELREIWAEQGSDGTYHYDSRRFIGLRVALHRNRLDLWRRWVTERRSVCLEPQRKIVPPDQARNPQVALYPVEGGPASVPYKPKQGLYDDPTDPELENMIADDQPHYG